MKKDAERIRIDATCGAEYIVRPFLMRINELPQIIVSSISKIHETSLGRLSAIFLIKAPRFDRQISSEFHQAYP